MLTISAQITVCSTNSNKLNPKMGLISVIISNHPFCPSLEFATEPQDVAVICNRLDSEPMPISEDEWNKGRIDFAPQLRPIVMKILNSTTDAYLIDEILHSILQTDNDILDELKDNLRALNSDVQWTEGRAQQIPILTKVTDELVKDGKIDAKMLQHQDTGPFVTYYKAKFTK